MSQLSTTGAPRRTISSRWKRGAAVAAGVAVVGTVLATGGPSGITASSHREAPLIAGDPRNDNTDVYAFVSPDAQDTVTMIANWIPFEEPNGGPNFYPWADDSRYNIKVDNDGDAVPDITYTWVFTTEIRNTNTFLFNTGPVTSLDDPDLNYYQTYDLIKRVNVGSDADESNDVETTILNDVNAAPSIAGEVSTPDYETLVDQTIAAGTTGALKSFVGQADDPFFLDLRVFDLLYGAGVKPQIGEDTLGGYNVNTIALQVPKSELALAGNATDNPVVGIWSTTDKSSIIIDDQGTPDTADDTYTPGFVQVSRLGNPLVNEVVIPLALKDAFNSIPPTLDATAAVGPISALGSVVKPVLPPVVQAIYGQPVPGDTNNTPGDTSDDDPRTDLVEIFLQGVSIANGGTGDPEQHPALKADLNSLALNADVTDITPSEMLRLNMAVPVAAEPNSAGVLAGDFQGFPNGRRLTDDVVDAALAVVEGIVYEGGADVSALGPFDSVDENDVDFRDVFPYVALPHLDSVNNGPGRPTPRSTEIVSFNPVRILETRGGPTYEQVGYTGPKPTAGQIVKVKVAGVTSESGEGNVPSDAKAVYLNVAATNAAAQGVLKVYPCGEAISNVFSNANPDPTRSVSALTPAVMDADGNVCIFTKESTDLIVDVSAYHPATSQFVPIVPERVLETRATEGRIGYTGAKPADGSVTRVKVTGTVKAGLPVGTKSVIVNLATVNTELDGFVTAYSCDASRPTPASNMNTVAGAIRSNPASVAVSASGEICLYTKGATDLVVDLMGAAPATSSFVPITPKRILETRATEGRIGYTGSKPIAGQIIELKVEGAVGGLDGEVRTVVLNVAGTENEAGSFITVFPCGNAVPNASNVNIETTTVASMVVTGLSEDGRVCLFNKASQHVIVDLQGYYPGTIVTS